MAGGFRPPMNGDKLSSNMSEEEILDFLIQNNLLSAKAKVTEHTFLFQLIELAKIKHQQACEQEKMKRLQMEDAGSPNFFSYIEDVGIISDEGKKWLTTYIFK